MGYSSSGNNETMMKYKMHEGKLINLDLNEAINILMVSQWFSSIFLKKKKLF